MREQIFYIILLLIGAVIAVMWAMKFQEPHIALPILLISPVLAIIAGRKIVLLLRKLDNRKS